MSDSAFTNRKYQMSYPFLLPGGGWINTPTPPPERSPVELFAMAIEALVEKTGERPATIPLDPVFFRALRLYLARTVEGLEEDYGSEGFMTVVGIDVFDRSRMYKLEFQ